MLERAGQTSFVFKDHLGSTRVVVSADGLSGVGYGYDALGNGVQSVLPSVLGWSARQAVAGSLSGFAGALRRW